jgi:hypothetical protein
MWHAWERGETCRGFWWGSPKENNHMEDQGVDGSIGSKWTLGRLAGGLCNGFTWLRIGTVGGLLCMRWWTFGFWRHGVSYYHIVRTYTGKPLLWNFSFSWRRMWSWPYSRTSLILLKTGAVSTSFYRTRRPTVIFKLPLALIYSPRKKQSVPNLAYSYWDENQYIT